MLAVEKRITSPLILPNSIEKIVEIDSHLCKFAFLLLVYLSKLFNFFNHLCYVRVCVDVACAMSGLIADAKTLIDKARVEAQVRFACMPFHQTK